MSALGLIGVVLRRTRPHLWRLAFGAHLTAEGPAPFRVWAPRAWPVPRSFHQAQGFRR